MEKSIYLKEYSLFLEQLRTAREEKGLTQMDLAERLGQTQSFVSKVERGERRVDVVELRAFCKSIGVPLAKFISIVESILDSPDSNRERSTI
ncbi:MAG: helix-turn-helix transcriptional regulator [Acidobacteria bacterium]|nr:helix-turn-helix transcriptional regulator [Acidobacteriota bacterium]